VSCVLGSLFDSLGFFSSFMSLFFILLYSFGDQFLAALQPNVGVKFSAHLSSFSRRILRVIHSKNILYLGCSFNVFATSFFQNGCNPSGTRKSAKITSVAEDLFKSFNLFTNPFDNPFRIASNKFLLG
jgi:hypothetical protein